MAATVTVEAATADMVGTDTEEATEDMVDTVMEAVMEVVMEVAMAAMAMAIKKIQVATVNGPIYST